MDRRDRVQPLRRVTVAALLGLLVAGAPAAVLGQDAGPSGGQAAASAAGVDLRALIPARLAGAPVPPENVTVRSGTALAQGSTALGEQYQAVVNATGVALDEMSQVTAWVQSEAGDLFYLGALRVPGAEATVVRDVVMPVALAGWAGASAAETELAGLTVTVIRDESSDVDGTYLYPAGELLWIASGPKDLVAAAFAEVIG